MHSAIFLLLAALASVVVGLIGSFVLAAGGAVHYPIQRLLGRTGALIIVTIINSALAIAWTAIVLLWLERGTPPYNPAMWAALLAGLLLIISPVATAYRSSIGLAAARGMTVAYYDLLRSLLYVFAIQVAAAIYMYLDRAVLHWWRWLPFTG